MKYVLWVVGGLFALVLAVGVLQFAASERVEVVDLHTIDANGEKVSTRLWVVDYDGHAYLRGDSPSGWFQRLQANEVVKMTRDGETLSYTHQLQNQNIGTINQLMRDKYTWGDQVIEVMIGTREKSNAIELTALHIDR